LIDQFWTFHAELADGAAGHERLAEAAVREEFNADRAGVELRAAGPKVR
jgi:hypothetical protein